MYQHSAAVTSDGKLYAPCQRPFGPNSLKDIATHTHAHTRARNARTHACTASSLRFADAGWPRQKRMPSVPD